MIEDRARIESFYLSLIKQGLSLKTARQHKENLYFFWRGFLIPSQKLGLVDVDFETIQYFLLSFYPDKFKASKSELLKIITSLRKFYRYLFEQGEISRKSWEEITNALSQKDLYLSQLKGKNTSKPDEEIYPQAGFWIDQGLYLLVHNLRHPRIRIVLDFQLFLDYLLHHSLKLTASRSYLPRNHLHRINQMFTEPEPLPQNATQDQSQRISIFYQLARGLDLFVIGSYDQLLATPRAEAFLELSRDEQLVVLIDALWNRVRWSELQRFGADGFASWAQENRGGFAELLSQLPADVPYELSSYSHQSRLGKILSNFFVLYDVVESRIMFALKEMGILDYELKYPKDIYSHRWQRGIKSITMTRFGKRIMKYLARKAQQELGVDSLIDLMEECLIYL